MMKFRRVLVLVAVFTLLALTVAQAPGQIALATEDVNHAQISQTPKPWGEEVTVVNRGAPGFWTASVDDISQSYINIYWNGSDIYNLDFIPTMVCFHVGAPSITTERGTVVSLSGENGFYAYSYGPSMAFVPNSTLCWTLHVENDGGGHPFPLHIMHMEVWPPSGATGGDFITSKSPLDLYR